MEGGPVSPAVVEHRPGCEDRRIVERDTARKRIVICKGCGAYIYLPRVTRWSE